MTELEKSRITYIIGRIEGIAAGCEPLHTIANALLDTAEMLTELIEDENGDA